MAIRKWLTFAAFFLFIQSLSYAGELITTVFNVIESQRTDSILILSGTDGRVYKAPRSPENLAYFKSFIGEVVKLTYSESGTEASVLKIQIPNPAEVDPRVMDLNHFQYNQLRRFAPTDLQSYEAANEIFKGMLNDGDRRRSQCFKRAHMWTYDMWSQLNVYSQKIFIFYTQRYIQLEDFGWWFHVAPMVVANGEELVLDGTFMSKPVTVREWQDYFIKSKKITCPVIEDYNVFSSGQWKRLCYLIKVPMYYFRPSDIKRRDTKGIERNHWVLEELQDARRAFKNYREVYEGLDTGKPTITH